jgi:inosine-uridine nucleoside N-ribohydrolase
MKIFYHFAVILLLPSLVAAQQSIAPDLIKPRIRVIIDNDFSGDPDGLFALAHLLLSPSVEVRGIIGSHLKPGDGFDRSITQADNAVKKAAELLAVMKLDGKVPVIAGSNVGMRNDSTAVKSKGVDLIIKEALRTDTRLPLYILCGAGLTEIASAALTDPRISDRLTVIWIGGPEYLDLAIPPPGYSTPEYNLNIDLAAGRALFNRTQVAVWQIPRDAYRQALVSYSLLQTKVARQGDLGKYLVSTIESLMARLHSFGYNPGETYILGDSPLVLLTALQSSFEADPSSSRYVVKPAPTINSQGLYEYNPSGRNIRVYHQLDVPFMLEDFYSKLELFDK